MSNRARSFDDIQLIRGSSNYLKAAKQIGMRIGTARKIRQAPTLREALRLGNVALDSLPPEVQANLNAADAAVDVPSQTATPDTNGKSPQPTLGAPLKDIIDEGAAGARDDSENTPVGDAGEKAAGATEKDTGNGGLVTIATPPGGGQKPPKETKPDPRRTPNFSEATRLYLTSPVFVMPNTPDMYVSYMCALKKGFTGTPASWFSIVARDYWEGRQVNMFQEVSGYVPSNDALQPVGANREGSGAVESDGSEDSAYE